MSRTLNVGLRSLILNGSNVVVGTILLSPRTNKWVYTRFEGDKVLIQVLGDSDWDLIKSQNPDWIMIASYVTVSCKLSADKKTVEIQVTHNHVNSWNALYEVAFEIGWSDKWRAGFTNPQGDRVRKGMETHIANLNELTV